MMEEKKMMMMVMNRATLTRHRSIVYFEDA
jgi:hypothetical protein